MKNTTVNSKKMYKGEVKMKKSSKAGTSLIAAVIITACAVSVLSGAAVIGATAAYGLVTPHSTTEASVNEVVVSKESKANLNAGNSFVDELHANTAADAKEAVIVEKTSGSTFVLPMKGIDWNYYADSLNVKVGCEIDFSCNLCNFNFTAVKPGTTNIDLKTKDTYGMWTVTPVRVTVNDDLSMKIVQTGNAYIV